MTFEEGVILRTISRLLSGEDYRDEIVNAINSQFFDFTMKFFREILEAKMTGSSIDMNWYRQHFITSENINPDDAAIYSD